MGLLVVLGLVVAAGAMSLHFGVVGPSDSPPVGGNETLTETPEAGGAPERIEPTPTDVPDPTVDPPGGEPTPTPSGDAPTATDAPSDPGSGGDSGSEDPSANWGTSVNQSALAYRVAAYRTLNGTSVDENSVAMLRSDLNDSFGYHEGVNRVNASRVFFTDRDVASATIDDVPNASAALVRGDRQLALTAIEDANRSLAVLLERNRSIENVSHLRELIDDARSAYQQGEEVRTAVATEPSSRLAAIRHYARAWDRAQRALDRMDRQTDPVITLASRQDPINGTNGRYVVTGSMFDVRPNQVEITLETDSASNETVLVAGPRPATDARFRGVATRNRTSTITITAQNHGSSYSENVTVGPQTGTETLRLDGDGLNDTYETALGTDPLDPDSDAPSTAIDESDNGTLDGREDFDRDGGTTLRELEWGTDPLDNDTDGDGLLDGIEVVWTRTDPLANDTDSDGTTDPLEDPDEDGLVNQEEIAIGTAPHRNDTDGDGLSDLQEHEGETSPLLPDTDDDGVIDPVELRHDFDPQLPDSDGDGVDDVNETVAETITSDDGNVTLSIRGPPGISDTVTLRSNTDAFNGTNATYGPAVRVRTRADFENATITFPVEANVTDRQFRNLSIWKWNGSANATYRPINTTGDVENRTLSSTVESFSYFIVTSGGSFVEATTYEPKPGIDVEDVDDFDCTGVCARNGSRLAVGTDDASGPEFGVFVGITGEDGEPRVQRVNPATGETVWTSSALDVNFSYAGLGVGSDQTVYVGIQGNVTALSINNGSVLNTTAVPPAGTVLAAQEYAPTGPTGDAFFSRRVGGIPHQTTTRGRWRVTIPADYRLDAMRLATIDESGFDPLIGLNEVKFGPLSRSVQPLGIQPVPDEPPISGQYDPAGQRLVFADQDFSTGNISIGGYDFDGFATYGTMEDPEWSARTNGTVLAMDIEGRTAYTVGGREVQSGQITAHSLDNGSVKWQSTESFQGNSIAFDSETDTLVIGTGPDIAYRQPYSLDELHFYDIETGDVESVDVGGANASNVVAHSESAYVVTGSTIRRYATDGQLLEEIPTDTNVGQLYVSDVSGTIYHLAPRQDETHTFYDAPPLFTQSSGDVQPISDVNGYTPSLEERWNGSVDGDVAIYPYVETDSDYFFGRVPVEQGSDSPALHRIDSEGLDTEWTRRLPANTSHTVTIGQLPSSNDGDQGADESTASFEYSIQDPHDLRVEYSASETGPNPEVSITVSEATGSGQVSQQLATNRTGVTSSLSLSSLDGSDLTVTITSRDASIVATDLGFYADSDDDGLHDYYEEQTITNPRYWGSLVQSDSNDADTDGDGIDDGDEVSYGPFVASVPGTGFVGNDLGSTAENGQQVAATSTDARSGSTNALTATTSASIASRSTISASQSLPDSSDSDGDGVDDGTERGGWEVSVVLNSTGHPYRWDYDNESPGTTREFESDPMDPDTDGDGLSDGAEFHDTHTDPEAPVTYAVTDRREEMLEEGFEATWGEFTLRHMGVPNSLTYRDLTDGSDDFDLVTTEPFPDPSEEGSMTFTALDGQTRTDTWLSNKREARAGTDPWDPDTDDDGLTDGQEERYVVRDSPIDGCLAPVPHRWCQRVMVVQPDFSPGTNPSSADSDGDGYWDGWLGVYDMSRSNRSILYRHNLAGNITGDEMISHQIGYHDHSPAKSSWPVGTDIDGDDDLEHANIHLGELHWGSDPTNQSSEPDTNVTLEVDFYEHANESLKTEEWTSMIEQNYRLYGINLTIQVDDWNVTTDELGYDYTNDITPISPLELNRIHDTQKNLSADHYMFVGTRAMEINGSRYWDGDQTGVSMDERWPVPIFSPPGPTLRLHMVIMYTEPYQDLHGWVPTRLNLNSSDRMRAMATKTATHEIGHQFYVGELDEDTREVYSGRESGKWSDPTVENIVPPNGSQPINDWSVMSGGINREYFIRPTNGNYTAFSIEELLSVELKYN